MNVALVVLLLTVWCAADGAALDAPDGVHVFAMTFMDIDLDQVYDGYSQILITSHDAATVRVKVPFAGLYYYQTPYII